MKKLIITSILLSLISCKEEPVEQYSLRVIRFVPDSLKTAQRTWIRETIRSASERMTTSDYEDVDETIEQAKYTSDQLFEIEVTGLSKRVNEYSNIDILPINFTEEEKLIFKKLNK